MSAPVDVLLVRLAERRIALPVEAVIAVELLGVVHPVPAAEPSCRGVTPSRGRLVPVVDLGAIIGAAPRPPGETGVVVKLGGGMVCLDVDDAEAILRAESLPLPPGDRLPWASGVIEVADSFVPVLDLAAAVSRLIPLEASS